MSLTNKVDRWFDSNPKVALERVFLKHNLPSRFIVNFKIVICTT